MIPPLELSKRLVKQRMRDGENTRVDYDFLSRFALSAQSDIALDEFKAPEVKKLTTTRASRRDLNMDCLQREVDKGTPAIHIKAHNDSKLIEGMRDDVIGVVNDLLLCKGAHVMITHNISVALGLVNGTMGVVYDIIWNTRGDEPLVVLLALRKKKSTTDGRANLSWWHFTMFQIELATFHHVPSESAKNKWVKTSRSR